MKFVNNPGLTLSNIVKSNNYSSIFVLTDSNTQKNCFPLIKNYLNEFALHEISVEAGENTKNIDTCIFLWEKLNEGGVDKHSLLVNLGGGMITDLGGFVGTTFKRGLGVINIPTSMLAIIDASIGGKNGINFRGVKNQIGTISQPLEVIISPLFLKTLGRKNYLSGFAEALKHGFLKGMDAMVNTLEFSCPNFDSKDFTTFLRSNIAIKQEIITKDPYEKADRKALNFGHTIGHALETFSHKSNTPLLHGEAVAWGVLVELLLSVELMGFSTKIVDRYEMFISQNFPKPRIDINDFDDIINYMKKDKKNIGSQINFTLLSEPGKYFIDQFIDENKIRKAMSILIRVCL